MTNVHQFPGMEAEYAARLELIAQQDRLKGGGGGGTSGGMSDDWKKSVEDRLGQLHSDVRELRTDLTGVKVDIATIKENMRHLPTQTWLFKAMAGMVAAIGVIVAVIVRFLPAAH